jgi:uncharacterized membrane protein
MKHLSNIGKRSPGGQRGVTFVWFTLFFPVLLGFFGLSYDMARLNRVSAALQNAADAAALDGAMSVTGSAPPYTYTTALNNAAVAARNNYANGKQVRYVVATPGGINPAAATPTFKTLPLPAGYAPAIQVVIHLSNYQNGGPLHFVFGSFLGMRDRDVIVQATAVRWLPAGALSSVKAALLVQ